jgi:hypothetical protein
VLKAIEGAAAPLNALYRKAPWSRFFLVKNNNGHIHKDMSCGTCFPTTQYGWLPQLSGKTEADAVADQGPLLCSVCFPSVRPEWTRGVASTRVYCEGGQFVAGTERRQGMKTYGRCPVCGSNEYINQGGAVRKHKPLVKKESQS